MRKILDLPETHKALADLGFANPPVQTPAELSAWLSEERRNYRQFVQSAGMKTE